MRMSIFHRISKQISMQIKKYKRSFRKTNAISNQQTQTITIIYHFKFISNYECIVKYNVVETLNQKEYPNSI